MGRGDALSDFLVRRGYSRRAFLKYCAGVATLLGLPATAAIDISRALGGDRRVPVIWLSFQECTGCTESLTRSYAPTFESLIFEFYSLDYHHTLQAAAGEAAEAARDAAIRSGGYLLVVDGSVPLAHGGGCSTIAGRTDLDILAECADRALAVIAVGSCAASGGLPGAAPNPTGAVSVEHLMERRAIAQRPLVNIPGCPPIPEAIAATLVHFVVFQRFPRLGELKRPLAIFASTVHDRCPRLQHFHAGRFAETFDDSGARKGWCLYRLGCKGPVTHNACPTWSWNGGTSFPIAAGHPCIGCSEPGFWDQGGLYVPLSPAEQSATPLSESAVRGQALYDSNCVYCHQPDASDIPVDADAVPRVYAESGRRSHRVALDDSDWNDLVQFLKAQRP